MKKFRVRIIKEDKEAYGGDLGRHGGSGNVRMAQSLKKGDIVQFQVADYRTNTRKYYKGILMMLKGEKGYTRVVSDRDQVKVTHEAEQTYKSSHDQQGTISDFVPVPEPYITEIVADELIAVKEGMNEDRYSQDIDIEGKARELAGLPEEAINDIASMAKQMKDKDGAGNRQDNLGEARFSEYGKIDAEMGNPPSKIGRGDEEYMKAYNAVLVAKGEEPLSVEKPDQKYLDALERGKLSNDYTARNRKDEGYRGSDEEKKAMSKMSNKELYKYVTRDRHTVPNLKGDMGPLPGLEGPFQFEDGHVLYYDPKAGKYYDRGKDQFVENPPGNRKDVEESHCGGKHPGNRRIKVRRRK